MYQKLPTTETEEIGVFISKGNSRFRAKWVSFLILVLILTCTFYMYMSNYVTVISEYYHYKEVDHFTSSDSPDSLHLPRQSKNTSFDSKNYTKWIIVATSKLPLSDTIQSLSRVLDWRLLVVTDEDAVASNWSNSSVTILDFDKQSSLDYNVLEFLPRDNPIQLRKIVGYLYAIQHGAKFIYDAGPPEIYESDTFGRGLVLKNSTRGLILANVTKSVINPYAHFGQRDLSPRGFPSELEPISQPSPSTYSACKMKTPIIQQILENANADLNHIFRQNDLNVHFDSSAPPLVLPKSVLAPFNSKSTLFHYDSFWALLLPASVSQDADIWRGYWAQPLLWSIDANLGYFHRQSNTNTTKHSNKSVHQAILPQASKTQTAYLNLLTEFLKTWSCAKEDLYSCMLAITASIADKGIWAKSELAFLRAWISDLKHIGYLPPPISKSSSSTSTPCLSEAKLSEVIFHGRNMSNEQTDKALLSRTHLREFCNFSSSMPLPSVKDMNERIYFPSTLLVVVFNEPLYKNIWLLDLIYRPHFPNVLNCGPLDNSSVLTTLLTSDKFKETNTDRISFVKANTTGGGGCFNYECALRAIDMNYDVDGYFLVQDDALVNIWNLDKYDKNETWMENKYLALNTALPANSTYWTWWSSQFGLESTKLTLKDTYESTNEHVVQFRKDRESFGINATTAMVSESELYYFPASRQEIYYEVGWIFRHHEVYLEIAIPMLASGLSSPDKLVSLPGMDLWGGNRELPLRFLEPTNDWIHPLKFSQLFENGTLRADYCDKYVSRLLNASLSSS